MPTQAGVWDEEQEINLPPLSPGWVAFALLSPLAFLPMAAALGWAEFAAGYSAGAVSALGRTVLYALGVHVLLVWPLCGFAFLQYAGRWTAFERVTACLLLLSPPVLSFLYFQTGQGLTDFWDLALTVVPAVGLGALLFERTGRPWVFSLVLALSTSVPWLWLGDRLGGFSPLFTYGVLQSDFQTLRAAFGALSLAVTGAALGHSALSRDEGKIIAGKTMAALGVLQLVVSVIGPILSAAFGEPLETLDPHWPLVVYPWLAMALIRHGMLGAKSVRVVLAAGAGAELLELGWLIRVGGAATWSHGHLAVTWITLAACAFLWARLSRVR